MNKFRITYPNNKEVRECKSRTTEKENNRIKSKTRCRVEHAFGFVTNSMNDFKIRSIGLRKAKGIIGLVNLVYNMCRYEQIIRLNLLSIKN